MRMKMRRKVTSVSRIPADLEEGGNGKVRIAIPQQAFHSDILKDPGFWVPLCSPNSSAEKCRVQKDLPLVRTISYSSCSPSPCGECVGLSQGVGGRGAGQAGGRQEGRKEKAQVTGPAPYPTLAECDVPPPLSH